MNTLVIATCVKQKQKGYHTAKELYTSDLFQKMRSYIERHGFEWRIISVEHGLLHPDEEICYYENNIFDQFRSQNKLIVAATKYLLKEKVRAQLSTIIERYDRIILMCGKHYRDVLKALLEYREKIGLTKVIDFFVGTKGIGEIKHKLIA